MKKPQKEISLNQTIELIELIRFLDFQIESITRCGTDLVERNQISCLHFHKESSAADYPKYLKAIRPDGSHEEEQEPEQPQQPRHPLAMDQMEMEIMMPNGQTLPMSRELSSHLKNIMGGHRNPEQPQQPRHPQTFKVKLNRKIAVKMMDTLMIGLVEERDEYRTQLEKLTGKKFEYSR